MFLDILIIVVFIVCVIQGYFKGMFGKIFDILGFIIGILLFKVLQPALMKLFLNSTFYQKIKNLIYLNLNIPGLFDSNDINLVTSADIDKLEIPNILKKVLMDFYTSDKFSTLNATTHIDYVIEFIANVISSLILAFIIVVLVYIVMSFLLSWSKVLDKLPILRKLDKLGGVALGVVNGAIAVLLLGIIIIIILILTSMPQFTIVKDLLQYSNITPNIFEDNLLLNFVISFIISFLV